MSQRSFVGRLALELSLPLAAVIFAGCEGEHYRERRRVIVEERGPVIEEPAPVVINEPPPIEVQEYYVSGGRYYYWHPRYNRYVIVERVPAGRRAVRVEKLPPRYVQRGNVQVPAPPEHRRERHED